MKTRKSKKKGVRYWKAKAWTEFSRYIRLRDAIKTTHTKDRVICCTCDKEYPAFGVGCVQAGHFVPGRGNAILFEESGCNAQCFMCNCIKKGCWPQYMDFMLKEYDMKVVTDLLRLNKTVRKYTPVELEELRDKYKKLYNDLKEMEL